MQEQNTRKMDRRTIYTRNTVKDALLELLEEQSFEKITVASLCRQAEITRAPFYLHFQSLDEVLDELLDDALGRVHSVLDQVGRGGAEEKCAYPFCRFLRENPKYQPLFFSDALRSRVMEHIAQLGEESFIRRLQGTSQCSPEVLRALFHFQINGCLAVCKCNVQIPDTQWNEIQCGVDRFLKKGFEEL